MPGNSNSLSKTNNSGGQDIPGPQAGMSLIEQYEPLIFKIIRDVPQDIKDDCYQAAVIGLLKAEKNKESVKHYKSYVFRCMKNEVIKEIAKLKGCGNGLFSLDKITFLLLGKYKKLKNRGDDTAELNLSDGRIKDLEKLTKLSSSKVKRI